MPKSLSDVEIERIKRKFKEMLRRDLTLDECKYLGLSSAVISSEDESDFLPPKS